jgi:hypothetical protein
MSVSAEQNKGQQKRVPKREVKPWGRDRDVEGAANGYIQPCVYERLRAGPDVDPHAHA